MHVSVAGLGVTLVYDYLPNSNLVLTCGAITACHRADNLAAVREDNCICAHFGCTLDHLIRLALVVIYQYIGANLDASNHLVRSGGLLQQYFNLAINCRGSVS